MVDLVQLIYASRPFGFDDGSLKTILVKSRFNNTRDDITGALICRPDVYLQLLEGPRAAVEAAFDRIRRDNRHAEVNRLNLSDVSERLFPAWAMRDDPARSWLWTPAEVLDGAIERATYDDLLAVFSRLDEEPN